MKNLKLLLGKRIKELRNKRGFSQQELAEMVDIDQRSLSSIECGNTFPSKSLALLAHALDVSIQDLFDFEHLTKTEKDMKNFIIVNLDKLGKKDIKTVYFLVRAMMQF